MTTKPEVTDKTQGAPGEGRRLAAEEPERERHLPHCLSGDAEGSGMAYVVIGGRYQIEAVVSDTLQH